MKIFSLLAAASSLGSLTDARKMIHDEVDKMTKQVAKLNAVLQKINAADTFVEGKKVAMAKELRRLKEQEGPLGAVTDGKAVRYQHVLVNRVTYGGEEGSAFGIFGPNKRLWGINHEGQIHWKDVSSPAGTWVLFANDEPYTWLAPHGNGLIALESGRIQYFPNIEAPKEKRLVAGILSKVAWDGKTLCGVNTNEDCYCNPFDGTEEDLNLQWSKLATKATNCFPDGDRLLLYKNKKFYAKEYTAESRPALIIPSGHTLLEMAVHGHFAVGAGENDYLYSYEKDSAGKFGHVKRMRKLGAYQTITLTDQVFHSEMAAKAASLPQKTPSRAPTIALSFENDVLYGNALTGKFKHGGPNASRFAVLGPKGLLWGIDAAGTIRYLDTKVPEPWQTWKHFADGSYMSVSAAGNGLIALLDRKGRFGYNLVYFPDITKPNEHRNLFGQLTSIHWNGKVVCGSNVQLTCWCHAFNWKNPDANTKTMWLYTDEGANDCFPDDGRAIVYKNERILAGGFAVAMEKVDIIKGADDVRYKAVSVYGNYLAGIVDGDQVYYDKMDSSRHFGIPNSIREVPGFKAISIYDPEMED